MILKRIWFSNQSEKHTIRSLCLHTRRLHNNMQYANKNTTNYLFRFRNSQKVNEACNGILITKVVQEHRMKILLPLHNTGFDSLQEYNKKESENTGEEMLCAILYLEKSDKDRFDDLKKRVENNYLLNKTEYPRTVTAVNNILLNYQPNCNYNRNPQSNRVINQLMFLQRGKTGEDKGNRKEKDQRPRINLDHITCDRFHPKMFSSI